MKRSICWAACLVALTALLTGCTTDPAADIVYGDGTRPSPEASAPACEPGEPLKVASSVTELPSRCPRSKPRDIGHSEEIYLGSVLADQPCRELPDFAGSWWKPVRPFPTHLKRAGHETFRGTMTLVDESRAEFVAPAIQMEMRNDTMRIPPKGRLALSFTRITGPINVGGCD